MSMWRARLVAALAVFALYVPSSMAGRISESLGAIALVTTTALLGWLLASGGPGAPAQVLCAAGVVVTLVLATLTSPLESTSPGLVPIFLSAALLMALRLPQPDAPQPLRRALGLVHLVSLVFGAALAFDVALADQFAVRWYSAFYPALLGNMVLLNDKPVLTFGTHSMAGFMVYLLFYDAYTWWRLGGGRRPLLIALGHLGLLVALTSTTSLALALVAGVQLVVRLAQRHRALVTPTAILVGAAVLATLIYLEYGPVRLWELGTDAVLGDRVRGLLSRYATGGLLASNFEYLSAHPLRPIGLGFSKDLYLGDSGILLSVMRGSLPLALFLYGGWLALCAHTLTSRAAALWLTVLTVAFEIGFTPLQYFRFIGFVPLYLLVLESRRREVELRRGIDGAAL